MLLVLLLREQIQVAQRLQGPTPSGSRQGQQQIPSEAARSEQRRPRAPLAPQPQPPASLVQPPLPLAPHQPPPLGPPARPRSGPQGPASSGLQPRPLVPRPRLPSGRPLPLPLGWEQRLPPPPLGLPSRPATSLGGQRLVQPVPLGPPPRPLGPRLVCQVCCLLIPLLLVALLFPLYCLLLPLLFLPLPLPLFCLLMQSLPTGSSQPHVPFNRTRAVIALGSSGERAFSSTTCLRPSCAQVLVRSLA